MALILVDADRSAWTIYRPNPPNSLFLGPKLMWIPELYSEKYLIAWKYLYVFIFNVLYFSQFKESSSCVSYVLVRNNIGAGVIHGMLIRINSMRIWVLRRASVEAGLMNPSTALSVPSRPMPPLKIHCFLPDKLPGVGVLCIQSKFSRIFDPSGDWLRQQKIISYL